MILIFALVLGQALCVKGSFEGLQVALGVDPSAWLGQRRNHLSRRFVLEDMQPVQSRGTCRLAWYTATPPKFGNAVLCMGAGQSCVEPCRSGFEKIAGTSLCIQKCPDQKNGPSHLCPISRTCIRAEAVCPMVSEVPFTCTAEDQLIGTCAKQSYQAVLAARKTNVTCKNGLIFKDHTGGWRCAAAPDLACAPGFITTTASQPATGAQCIQQCPDWLVDCGESCNMPGVPCSAKPVHLCPVVPVEGCDMSDRSNTALQAACQAEGFRSTAGCPLSLTLHGGCGGARLQVVAGLHNRGFVSKMEAWWGPSPAADPLPDFSTDEPLLAIRLTFTGDTQPVVFGKESITLAASPRLSFGVDPSELVISSTMWSSSTLMDGSSLTPIITGFSMFTTLKNHRVVGRQANGLGLFNSNEHAEAWNHWHYNASLSGPELGVGLPVGAAAFSSGNGIHAFGLLFLSRVPKQEL